MKDTLEMININPLHEDIKAYAVTYFLTREKDIDNSELRRFAYELMASISGLCMKQGAKVIGHIKAYIEYDSGFLHANTVGESVDITVNGRDGEPSRRFKMVVNSIIYGLTDEKIKDATEEAIHAVASAFGFSMELDSRFVTTSLI